MHAELNMACAEQFGMLPDCNCPHEHWHIGQARFCLDLHFEDDGSCHVLLMDDDGEDIETDFTGHASIDTVRPLALAWASLKVQAWEAGR